MKSLKRDYNIPVLRSYYIKIKSTKTVILNNKLENIEERTLFTFVKSEAQETLGRNKEKSLPTICRQCSFRFACHAEYLKHRFCYTTDGEYELNYPCQA
jgi:radical SAM protein with 4Fe4S-binding SPASM domain